MVKSLVTARCGMNIKNQVTLSFVDDYVNNRIILDNDNIIDSIKEEYQRRILNNITNDKFPDFLKEK